MAVAILECAPQSHPFEERNITLTEPVKVGRSVARIRPAVGNAIFDCKVLSRNHALLWYENGKFYLQDTKSSNGTFVNNNRLSKGTEESPPKEIFSGDVVKFGVDVVENSRNVTHNCIIAKIKLYHADGVEAMDSSRVLMPSSPGSTRPVLPQELYQLAQYLQEALHREQILESKLAALQKLVVLAQDSSENGWQALIDEDRLLSRLEMLENRLLIYSKNYSEDTLRKDLVISREDLYNYEKTAKESLRKMLEEKLEALRRVSELESSLSTSEEECNHLRQICETAQKELDMMTEKHDEQVKEVERLQHNLEEVEKERHEEIQKLLGEKSELDVKLEEYQIEEDKLVAKIESLQANNDFMKEQLTNMKARLDSWKENELQRSSLGTDSKGVQVELVNLLDLRLLQQGKDDGQDDESCEEKGQREQDSQDSLRVKLKEAQDKVDSLKNELQTAQDIIPNYKVQLASQEDILKGLESQWKESKASCENLHIQLESLQLHSQVQQSELNEAQKQLVDARKEVDSLRMRLAEALESAAEPTTPVSTPPAPFFSLLSGASQLTLKPGRNHHGTWILPKTVEVVWCG